MRAQIQRTKLFRSLAVERDSIPLHSTPLDSIRIRIEFRFSFLSLSLFLSLSDSLTRYARQDSRFSRRLVAIIFFFLLEKHRCVRDHGHVSTIFRAFSRPSWFSTLEENRSRRRKRERENKEREGKEKRRKGGMKNERAIRDTRFAYLRLLQSLGGRRVAAHRHETASSPEAEDRERCSELRQKATEKRKATFDSGNRDYPGTVDKRQERFFPAI